MNRLNRFHSAVASGQRFDAVLDPTAVEWMGKVEGFLPVVFI